jgi:hypothetical protein
MEFHDPTAGQLRESAELMRAYRDRIKRAPSTRELSAIALELEVLPRGLRTPLVAQVKRRMEEVP